MWETEKGKETILTQGLQKGILPYLLRPFELQLPMAVIKYLKK